MISLFVNCQFHQGVLSFSPLCWCEGPTWQLVPSSVHSSADCSGFFCMVLAHPWQRPILHRGCAFPSHCSHTCFILLFFSKKENGNFFSGFLSVLFWLDLVLNHLDITCRKRTCILDWCKWPWVKGYSHSNIVLRSYSARKSIKIFLSVMVKTLEKSPIFCNLAFPDTWKWI